MANTVMMSYMEFMCADEATQSELWNKSMKELQKYRLENLHLSEKEGSVPTMMYEQDANQKAHPLTMAGNRHYAAARHPSKTPGIRLSADDRQVEAALAQAFEQRTANLLELLNYTTAPEKFNPLMRIIEKRLGQ